MSIYFRAFNGTFYAYAQSVYVSCLSIQLDPDNSNSDHSKSPLIQSNTHSPRSSVLLNFTSLIRTPVNSNHFLFLMGLQINGVQFYRIIGHSYIFDSSLMHIQFCFVQDEPYTHQCSCAQVTYYIYIYIYDDRH